MREQALACTDLPLEELQAIFSALGKAATVPDVLTALVNGLSREFSRVALFNLHGNRLEGVQHIGFELKSDISKVAIPTTVDSLLTRAITSGAIESFVAGTQTKPCNTPFGGAPSCALALPIVLNGQTLGVIYADDSDKMEFASSVPPQLLAKFAELLLQHTLLVLLRAGTDQKQVAELKAYATMLLDEMEYGYAADAEAGYSEAECRRRLMEALECSRRIFAGRTAGEGAEAAAIFDEKLAATVEARNGTRFGRDLAGVAREAAKAASASALANCG
jgi:hypothetical protein